MNAPFHSRARDVEADSTTVSVIVLDGVSLTTLATTIEPFHLANTLQAKVWFDVRLVSFHDHDPVTATGVAASCRTPLDDVGYASVHGPEWVILCGGQRVDDPQALRAFLRNLARTRCNLFAIGGAGAVAASLGMTLGGRCSMHWKSIAPLSETFPKLEFERTLFTSSGAVSSCAGEFAAFDLVVELIEGVCGPKVGAEICNHFLAHGRRSGKAEQLLSGDTLICDDAKFLQAVQIMTENIEDPLSGPELAARLGVSTRQVQRIFADNGFEPPLKYYLALRLNRAQQLVEQTRMTIAEICFACGFDSFSRFSTCYKRQFGKSPKETRNKLRLKCQLSDA